jgi:hypothetical protein
MAKKNQIKRKTRKNRKLRKTRKNRKNRNLRKTILFKGGSNYNPPTKKLKNKNSNRAEDRNSVNSQATVVNNQVNAANSQATVINNQATVINNEGPVNYPIVRTPIGIRGISIEYNPHIRRVDFFVENRKIGFTTFNIIDSTFVINTINVEESVRGNGYGKGILKYLIQHAFDELGLERIKLTDKTKSLQYNPSQRENNMYSKAGFVHTHPGHPYQKDDMVLMSHKYFTEKEDIFAYLDS